MDNNILSAFLLTLSAGFATGIGSIIALFAKKTNKKFLAAALGFSAGVMLYISFVEMLDQSKNYLISDFGVHNGNWICLLAFLGGMLLIMLIDNLIPSPETNLTSAKTGKEQARLERTGILMTLAIAIHNFPEGLATFTASLNSISLGAAIDIAIAIHNIPEGIVTSIPIYYATGNKKKAFFMSFLSGITEPIGAILGYVFLRPFLDNTLYGIIFGMISGIMVYISIEELIPMSREYDKGNSMIFGAISGIAIMAISLIFFM
jgi:ZIP family zinc transporter